MLEVKTFTLGLRTAKSSASAWPLGDDLQGHELMFGKTPHADETRSTQENLYMGASYDTKHIQIMFP